MLYASIYNTFSTTDRHGYSSSTFGHSHIAFGSGLTEWSFQKTLTIVTMQILEMWTRLWQPTASFSPFGIFLSLSFSAIDISMCYSVNIPNQPWLMLPSVRAPLDNDEPDFTQPKRSFWPYGGFHTIEEAEFYFLVWAFIYTAILTILTYSPS